MAPNLNHDVIYSLQITTGSLSFIASLTIVIMIKRASLSTPYRRLIFGLSFADLLQSFAMVTGPFASPPGVYPWAVGNIQTCNANGFLIAYGSTAVPMYLLCLSYYYYCKLKRKMTDRSFCLSFEWKAHLFINGSLLIACIWALVLKTFNGIYGGTICHFARYPLGCGTFPEIVGECTRGIYVFPFLYILLLGVTSVCLVGTFILMGSIAKSAARVQRIYSSESRSLQADDSTCAITCCNWCKCQIKCFLCFHQKQGEDESDANYIIRLYRRENETQAFLYVGSFFISYSVVLVVTIAGMCNYIMPGPIQIVISILYPIMGLLNILIYTRPKVKKFRYSYTDYSWIRSLLLVIKAGGEVPDVQKDPDALILFTNKCLTNCMDWICCCFCFGCCFYLWDNLESSNLSNRDSGFISSLFRMRGDSSLPPSRFERELQEQLQQDRQEQHQDHEMLKQDHVKDLGQDPEEP